MKRALVTGAAGFVGSHLSSALARAGFELTLLDNFSSGNLENYQSIKRVGQQATELRGDCKNPRDVKRALSEANVVFHFAANPEVRPKHSDSSVCFMENVYATYVLLEQLKNSQVETIVFPSSSTVYGEARLIPTPEDYGPLEPISLYGSSKLAAEALITAYCHSYDKTAVILRLANVIGPSSNHGVINDFLSAIKSDRRKLRILGDGRQTKSYIHIEDCVSGILRATESANKVINVFNVGSEDQTDVMTIASIVIEEIGLKNVPREFVMEADEGRGWKGDVKNMLLDIGKLKSKGWRPKFTSEEAVRFTVRSALHNNLNPRLSPETPTS